MTEEEWLVCRDPGRMIAAVGERATDRKLRLLGCAYYRRHWGSLVDELGKKAVEAAEEFVDTSRCRDVPMSIGAWQGAPEYVIGAALATGGAKAAAAARVAEYAYQAALVRDLFAHPFRPMLIEPGWLTADVRGLAAAA